MHSIGVTHGVQAASLTAPTRPTVSVIVPVYNGGEAFRRCLEALRSTDPAPYELIVVADGDTDGSRDVARRFDAQVLEFAQPNGPAVARNAGAAAASGEILFFIDADVAVRHDTIGQVAATFAADPSLTALIGSYDDAPGADDFLSQYKNLLHHFTHQTGRAETFTFWGACGAIRRAAFLASGGFDERYRKPSIEDIELGYRLSQAGNRLRLDKTLQVKHLKRWGALNLLRTDFFGRALPWTELIHRHGSMANDLNLGLSSRLSVVAVYTLGASLLVAARRPQVLAVAGVLAGALVALNMPVYRFFFRKRGLRFTLGVIPWHWLYFGYSGLAFLIGSYRAKRIFGRRTRTVQ
ncbi:MAG: glycosyltransferase [Oscillochloris sp.]|nr:glycosyltransferase [Oscillochloris sp.]